MVEVPLGDGELDETNDEVTKEEEEVTRAMDDAAKEM